MAKFTFGGIQLGASTQPVAASQAEPNSPFRIAVLGDFSGRANRGLVETGSKLAKKPVVIDRDNFDDVMARMNVKLSLPLEGPDSPRVTIEFKTLDDFHPDKIYEHVELFQALRRTRKKLNNSSTFKEAAEEVRRWAPSKPAAPPPTPTTPAAPPPGLPTDGASLLDAMLGGGTAAPATPAPLARVQSDWNNYISSIVQPYLVEKTDPDQPDLVRLVDEATGRTMNRILHHPEFQKIESAWRALFFMIKKLDTDEKLKVFVIDLSKEELMADLESAADDFHTSGVYKLIVEQTVGTPNAPLWAALVTNFEFGPTPVDMAMLGALGSCARLAGAPILAGGSAKIVGCPAFQGVVEPRDWELGSGEGVTAWNEVKTLADAAYIGLAAPRYLLRLPYGKRCDPIEAFQFEEMSDPPKHNEYLWGNGAFAVGYLLGEAYSQGGWNMRPGILDQIDGLPLHVYDDDGESALKPVGEAILIERAIEALTVAGLIPVVTMKDSDTIRLPTLQSITGKPIAGRWPH